MAKNKCKYPHLLIPKTKCKSQKSHQATDKISKVLQWLLSLLKESQIGHSPLFFSHFERYLAPQNKK